MCIVHNRDEGGGEVNAGTPDLAKDSKWQDQDNQRCLKEEQPMYDTMQEINDCNKGGCVAITCVWK